MIVHGQTHGAVVQGLGQAMIEACVLDPQTGQPLSGSLMDYGLLRADDVPSIAVELNEVLSPTNPLGIKAGGEGGTTVSPAPMETSRQGDQAIREEHVRQTPLRRTGETIEEMDEDGDDIHLLNGLTSMHMNRWGRTVIGSMRKLCL